MRDALAATKEFQGVTGKISINADRNAVARRRPEGRERKFVYAATINPEDVKIVGVVRDLSWSRAPSPALD